MIVCPPPQKRNPLLQDMIFTSIKIARFYSLYFFCMFLDPEHPDPSILFVFRFESKTQNSVCFLCRIRLIWILICSSECSVHRPLFPNNHYHIFVQVFSICVRTKARVSDKLHLSFSNYHQRSVLLTNCIFFVSFCGYFCLPCFHTMKERQ